MFNSLEQLFFFTTTKKILYLFYSVSSLFTFNPQAFELFKVEDFFDYLIMGFNYLNQDWNFQLENSEGVLQGRQKL